MAEEKDSEGGGEGVVNSNAWATSANLRKAAKRDFQDNQREQEEESDNLLQKVAKRQRKERRKVSKVAEASGVTQFPSTSPTPMPAAGRVSLLICSVGNPGSSYANTLHSAGHTVLNRLVDRLGYPSPRKDRSLGNGRVSKSSSSENEGDWTLWQSTSYMNESGKGVRAAWSAWSKNIPEGQGKLVVIYDELEKALGTVTLRTNQGASAKGHNGLRSIMSMLGNTPFARIGIGIGRPESRESDDVARYVLRKMTEPEKRKIEESVEDVLKKLQGLEQV